MAGCTTSAEHGCWACRPTTISNTNRTIVHERDIDISNSFLQNYGRTLKFVLKEMKRTLKIEIHGEGDEKKGGGLV